MFRITFLAGRGGPVVRHDASIAPSLGDAAQAAVWTVVNGKALGATGFEVLDQNNGAILLEWHLGEHLGKPLPGP